MCKSCGLTAYNLCFSGVYLYPTIKLYDEGQRSTVAKSVFISILSIVKAQLNPHTLSAKLPLVENVLSTVSTKPIIKSAYKRKGNK